jgi:hypothetical protein
VAITGGALLAVDGVTLTVRHDAECAEHEVSAEESRDRVVLHAVDTPLPLIDCPSSEPYASMGVILARPLGSRSIVDGVSDRVLAVFDEHRAYRFANPPPGSSEPPGKTTIVPDFTGLTIATIYPGPVIATDRQVRDPGPVRYAQLLWVVQTTGAWTPPATLARTPVTVRGHPGEAAPGIVVWAERGYVLAIRYDTAPWLVPSTDQLLALAATLIPGEG